MSTLRTALAELKEVISRAQADNIEIGEALNRMESIVGEIERKIVAPTPFVNAINIASNPLNA